MSQSRFLIVQPVSRKRKYQHIRGQSCTSANNPDLISGPIRATRRGRIVFFWRRRPSLPHVYVTRFLA